MAYRSKRASAPTPTFTGAASPTANCRDASALYVICVERSVPA
jgi:hypothetical protein